MNKFRLLIGKYTIGFLFVIAYLLVKFCEILFFVKLKKNKKQGCNLCIEAGSLGWQSIEFKSLLESSIDYLGKDMVVKHEVIDKKKYFESLKNIIHLNRNITHYFYDWRTYGEENLKGVLMAFRIAIFFGIKGIVPIVLMTDGQSYPQRLIASIVSALSGVVITFYDPSVMKLNGFPHNRIIGPTLFPLSKNRLSFIKQIKSQVKSQLNNNDFASFVGSLGRNAREAFIQSIKEKVELSGKEFRILSRNNKIERLPESEYFNNIISSKIVLTTICPETTGLFSQIGVNQCHLTYRFMEVLASGSLLMSPLPAGVEKYFAPYKHFVPFDSEEDATSKILYYLNNENKRKKIAKEGEKKAKDIVNSQSYWLMIEAGLGPNGLKRM